ncbi:hypothetical protein OG819_46285 [Streptomyces sp. NBC_01549]|uniref:hypothetical protein n=1 Tax=Streptomyces sp. NBC_01549 TaxID=2975874 RepID=UPI002253B7B0|nr:hypothetical protein [Streptomyces sp. NBC_01549]MCX4596787.1 hypothetical protein [Streptomyces sp. NBC_01549]
MLLFTDADSALAELARHVRGSWANLLGDEGVPNEPPTDDRTAVDLYYGPERNNRPDEGYSLYAADISGTGRTRVVSLDFRLRRTHASARTAMPSPIRDSTVVCPAWRSTASWCSLPRP